MPVSVSLCGIVWEQISSMAATARFEGFGSLFFPLLILFIKKLNCDGGGVTVMEYVDIGIWMVLGVGRYYLKQIHNACLSVFVCKQISGMAATARLMILGLWIPFFFFFSICLSGYQIVKHEKPKTKQI